MVPQTPLAAPGSDRIASRISPTASVPTITSPTKPAAARHARNPVATRGFNAWAMWFGRIRKHSTNEASNTVMTVKGMSAIISPNVPPMAVSPKKAMTVVSVAENTGSAMREADRSAAS